MGRRFWFIGLPVLLIVTCAGGLWIMMPRNSLPGDPGDEEQVAFGLALYTRNCARCHGEDLGGELSWAGEEAGLSEEELDGLVEKLGDVAPAHDQTGETSRHDDATLFRIIDEGTEAALGKTGSRMRGFGDRLDDEEIWAIIAFLKSHWQDAGTP